MNASLSGKGYSNALAYTNCRWGVRRDVYKRQIVNSDRKPGTKDNMLGTVATLKEFRNVIEFTAVSYTHLFRVRGSDSFVGEIIAKFALEDIGATRIGVIYNNDDYGTGGRDVVVNYLTENGVEPVVVEGHNTNDTDIVTSPVVLSVAHRRFVSGVQVLSLIHI